jgi:hypothetical protein
MPMIDVSWVLLTEAAEGGLGIAGTAFGREEFAALARKGDDRQDVINQGRE